MSTVPANAKKPSDRKPREAAKAEAQDESTPPFVFEWRDQTYTIETEAFDDVDVLERLAEINDVEAAANQGDVGAAAQMTMSLTMLLKNIMGASDWNAWKAANKVVSPSGRAHTPTALMMEFFNDLMEGANAGNSSASPS